MAALFLCPPFLSYCSVLRGSFFSPMLGVSKKWGSVHAWGIHGIYVGYSWGIHGIFICIGYVSGMYRVCIGKVSKGTGSVGGGMPTTDEHGWTRKHGDIMNDNIDNLRPNQYLLGAKREICQPLNCTELHGNKGYIFSYAQSARNLNYLN